MNDIEQKVIEDILNRQKLGIKKYGKTLGENNLKLKERLQHAYEECLDQANYLKWAICKIDEEETLSKSIDGEWSDWKEHNSNICPVRSNDIVKVVDSLGDFHGPFEANIFQWDSDNVTKKIVKYRFLIKKSGKYKK